MAYQLQGSLLEVCTCRVLCPCWIGEDPDGDICQSVNSWHIEQGAVDNVDISDLTVATLFSTIPGSPAYVSKATYYRAQNATLGFDIDLQNHNAIQGHFRFEG